VPGASIAVAANAKLPWLCSLRAATTATWWAAARTVFQWMPSSPAMIMLELRFRPRECTSSSRDSAAASGWSSSTAGPMLISTCSLFDSAASPLNSASACARGREPAYCMKGWVVMRTVCTL
jgi:hypothetical protein